MAQLTSTPNEAVVAAPVAAPVAVADLITIEDEQVTYAPNETVEDKIIGDSAGKDLTQTAPEETICIDDVQLSSTVSTFPNPKMSFSRLSSSILYLTLNLKIFRGQMRDTCSITTRALSTPMKKFPPPTIPMTKKFELLTFMFTRFV